MVPAGAVSADGARATGSFRVRNTGRRAAKASTAWVQVDGRTAAALPVGALAPRRSRTVRFAVTLPVGRHTVSVCADARRQVKESREKNNCRVLGRVTRAPSPTAPADPVPYTDGEVTQVGTGAAAYWVHVPTTYDDSHQTPIGLVAFLHGCDSRPTPGKIMGDTIEAGVPDLARQPYIVMTPSDPTAGCWDADTDTASVLAALSDVRTVFNIAPRKVVMGGYSSGGPMAGSIAFANATAFAGVVSAKMSVLTNRVAQIPAAAWKLNVAMRGDENDPVVNVSGMRQDHTALVEAAFPVTYSETQGFGHSLTGADLQWLFGQIQPSWTAP